MCAAVADYKPKAVQDKKMKKSAEALTIELVRTPDILGSARDKFNFKGILVGFAAETDNVTEYAKSKLEKKKCDLIVANDVSRTDIGFDTSENEVTLITADSEKKLEKNTKEQIALQIIEEVGLLKKNQQNS